MTKFLKKIFIFSLPLLIKYFFLLCFVYKGVVEMSDVGEDILFFIALAGIAFSGILKFRFWHILLCLIYVFYVLMETTSYLAVTSNFTSSYMFLLIESNKQELGEFVSAYSNVKILGLLLLLLLSFFVIKKIEFRCGKIKKLILGLILPILVVIVLKITGLIERNAYYNILRGIYGYYDLQHSVKLDANIKTTDLNITSNNEVLVFVLGESTARGHMQIYGYNKPTTPFLESIKDSLLLYNNAISTDVFTLKCIPKILTKINPYSSNGELINLIHLFNAANFSTYWLSNQRAISYHDNAINKLASASNFLKFYNFKDDVYTNILDDVVLKDYESILNKPGKKLIFIKLIGTHFDYKNRYPLTFSKFTNIPSTTNEQVIKNEYDNAVLYNDFIVYSLIETLKKVNAKSALLYLSDHGENVYDDDTDFFGRNEQRLTRTMFEIPFLVWTSNSFEFPNDFSYNSNLKFMSDKTFESVTHLFGVKHNSMETKNSIFSKDFKETPRKIVDYSIDFDAYFLRK